MSIIHDGEWWEGRVQDERGLVEGYTREWELCMQTGLLLKETEAPGKVWTNEQTRRAEELRAEALWEESLASGTPAPLSLPRFL